MRLIDADALLEQYCSCTCAIEDRCDMNKNHCENAYMIFTQPTIDPVKHGRWTIDRRHEIDHVVIFNTECSECGHYSCGEFKFCPHCGAKMDT